MKTLKSSFVSVLLCASSASLYAQQFEAKGSIIDEDGMPIVGATIVEKGTTNGTSSDENGQFSLSVNKGATLVVGYIGYLKFEGSAENIMRVILKEDAVSLEEVVVTGYTTQRKADLTGSVSVVQTKDLKSSSDSDPMRALQGKVAGMTITTDGSPSGAGTVRIRGIGSFNSSQDPLFVIDGVPTTASLNSLNMNDIESMQVLKDAASASIYGSRAANGVIIITTRKGKKGDKVKVNLSANVTAQFYTPQATMDLCNTSEYATAMAQAALND